MITVQEESSIGSQFNPLRPLNVLKDLNPVADLIEICFRDTMDADGREYLRQMRRMANDSNLTRLAVHITDPANLPISGFVWEENGQIVGNLSLLPINSRRFKSYLIANVAVHPDFRHRGIGHLLTKAAINYAKERGYDSCWLQVRVENLSAYHLYQHLGFRERARRTTWLFSNRLQNYQSSKSIPLPITVRYPSDWSLQQDWLNQLYPSEITWNLPMQVDNLGPGFFRGIIRFINDENIRHWAARREGTLAGVLTWQPTHTASDNLWLAVPPDDGQLATQALLMKVVQSLRITKPLALNLPAGSLEKSVSSAGFLPQFTLAWMEVPLFSRIEINS